MHILDNLITYANKITSYTIDTEGQMQPPPLPSKVALLQIETLYSNNFSIIILIDVLHLPPQDSELFTKGLSAQPLGG